MAKEKSVVKSEKENNNSHTEIELHKKQYFLLEKILYGNKSKMDWLEMYFEINPTQSIKNIDNFLDAHLELEEQNKFFVELMYKSGIYIIENKIKNSNPGFFKRIKTFIISVFQRIAKQKKSIYSKFNKQ